MEAERRHRRQRRARRRSAQIESYSLVDIAERDGWRCQLCGKRVSRAEVVPHLKAPTIDHIIPLAEAGDDVRANVQLAHFICNSRKGDRAMNDQLLLIG